jgi:hypothetical protein
MKKFVIAFLLILSGSSTLPLLVNGQTASPGGTIRDSVKTKVDEQLSQIKKDVAKKAFLGEITTISDALLTLTTFQGQTRSVTVTPDTIVKLTGNKDGTPADLKLKDYILVMGDVDSQNTMTAKRLLVIGKPETDKRRAVMGTITKSSASSITLVTPISKETWIIKLTSTTEYTAKTKAADIKVDTRIISLGTVTGTNTANALQIHLVPASVSATPKISP